MARWWSGVRKVTWSALTWQWPHSCYGTNTFYVIDPVSGARADIGVVREPGRAPYLRTYADRQWNNNLLSLNQCPI
ncbi:DUF3892 domain-containing protein [Pseudomonas tructae]|uniref:DUF3892 domain-containing protein n=1 Tax=Pseudomonas tructae TaxID=2518644 RepID=A0A411MIP4_9PSED|nr:DUF3892 domain-containing protein [Pseudomonas tructae]